MTGPTPETVRQQIAWSYANLARAHAALDDGASVYQRVHHMIRSKLYRGLVTGDMSVRSLFDDERLKMTAPQACYYCGSVDMLAVDHLVPRVRGGQDEADNLVWACRRCNSSKQGKDMLEWMSAKGTFPPLLLLRRYLKIVARYCDRHQYMDLSLGEAKMLDTPFDLSLLPFEFPPLPKLSLWVYPSDSGE